MTTRSDTERHVHQGEWCAACVTHGEMLAQLVCSICLFVGDSEDPRPITIMNGQLVCEPHNGYVQGGDHVSALIAAKREKVR